jgi:hypothetical protein
MNLLRSLIAASSIILIVLAANAAPIVLEKSDFAHARQVRKDGAVLVQADLNEQGLAKIKTLNQTSVGKEIETHLGGEVSHLKLRVPISDGQLEAGPFSPDLAKKIVEEINHQQ